MQFAKGNLVYDQGRFKMHSTQYGRCFSSNGDVSDNYKVSGTFDIFGWGTAGWNNGNQLYMPYTNSNATVGVYDFTYGYGYGPTDGSNYKIDLTGTYANSDWGVYQFGMGAESGWRTLTSAEWAWVLGPLSDADPGTNCRTSSTVNNIQNARFAKATVNSKAGVIIFPDNYTHPSGVTQPTNINGYTSSYTGNSYDATQWSSMESAGAVFLPAAGYRYGTSVNYVGSYGYYWSSTSHESNASNAYYVYFNSGNLYPQDNGSRSSGYSVRLVRVVE